MRLVDFLPLVGLRRKFVKLGQAPRQALASLGQLRLRLLGLRKRVLVLLPRVKAGVQIGQRHAAVAVEQGALRRGLRQALPGVLAMNIHQLRAQLAQLRHGGRPAINKAPATALPVNYPA